MQYSTNDTRIKRVWFVHLLVEESGFGAICSLVLMYWLVTGINARDWEAYQPSCWEEVHEHAYVPPGLL
jgi:hypothetical protein